MALAPTGDRIDITRRLSRTLTCMPPCICEKGIILTPPPLSSTTADEVSIGGAGMGSPCIKLSTAASRFQLVDSSHAREVVSSAPETAMNVESAVASSMVATVAEVTGSTRGGGAGGAAGGDAETAAAGV